MVTFRVECEGQIFNVSGGISAQYHYTWTSGPHDGYGFSTASNSETPLTLEDHRRNIREFLAQIDPDTGYIED